MLQLCAVWQCMGHGQVHSNIKPEFENCTHLVVLVPLVSGVDAVEVLGLTGRIPGNGTCARGPGGRGGGGAGSLSVFVVSFSRVEAVGQGT